MDLHAREGPRERLLEDLLRAFLARENRAARHHLGMLAGDGEREVVERPCHPGLVRVGKRHHPIDAPVAQRPHRLGDADPVADLPGMFGEPPPDRLGEAVGKEMRVGVDDHAPPLTEAGANARSRVLQAARGRKANIAQMRSKRFPSTAAREPPASTARASARPMRRRAMTVASSLPTSGLLSKTREKASRSTSNRPASQTATTVALRGSPVRTDISPKNAPRSRRATSLPPSMRTESSPRATR